MQDSENSFEGAKIALEELIADVSGRNERFDIGEYGGLHYSRSLHGSCYALTLRERNVQIGIFVDFCSVGLSVDSNIRIP